MYACERGREVIVKALLDKSKQEGADTLELASNYSDTALIKAVY